MRFPARGISLRAAPLGQRFFLLTVRHMANHVAAARLRRELAARIPAPPSIGTPAPIGEPFTDAMWRESRLLREAVDSIVHPVHWAVTIVPIDGVPRRYFFKGTHASVAHRAHAIFPADKTAVVLIEPARSHGLSVEFIDRRFNLAEK